MAPSRTADERQKALIDAIRSGVRSDDAKREWPHGWSLIADAGVRKFIDAVVTKLRPQPPQAPVTAPSDMPTIYIVHDATTAEDTRVALDLKDQIGRHEKMQVFVSRADLSSPTELKLWHENLLRSCDGVLLYRNAAPEGWWNQLAPEIILAERRFERQPMKSRAFLLPRPPSWEVGPDVKVIPYQAPFELNKLEPFLDPLRHEMSDRPSRHAGAECAVSRTARVRGRGVAAVLRPRSARRRAARPARR